MASGQDFMLNGASKLSAEPGADHLGAHRLLFCKNQKVRRLTALIIDPVSFGIPTVGFSSGIGRTGTGGFARRHYTIRLDVSHRLHRDTRFHGNKQANLEKALLRIR
jgi:hypothetical protein